GSLVVPRGPVVGDLTAVRLVAHPVRYGALFWVVIACVCITSLLCYRLRSTEAFTSDIRPAWSTMSGSSGRSVTLVAMTVVRAIELAMWYGHLVHPTEYYWVMVRRNTAFVNASDRSVANETVTAGDAMCGLLVLETATDFRVWTSRDRRGRVEVFHLGDGSFVTQQGGPGDLIDVVNLAAGGANIAGCVDAPKEFHATNR